MNLPVKRARNSQSNYCGPTEARMDSAMDLSALISFCTLVSMATSRSSKPVEVKEEMERGREEGSVGGEIVARRRQHRLWMVLLPSMTRAKSWAMSVARSCARVAR